MVRGADRDNRLFRAVFDGAPTALLIADHRGCYIDANPAACTLFGRAKAELLGRRLEELTTSLVRSDGTQLELEATTVANILPGIHLSVVRDVTERTAADRSLHESERRLRTVISNAPVILFAIDRHGIYTLYEGKGVALAVPDEGAIVGRSALERRRDNPHAIDAIRRALAGETVVDEFSLGRSWVESTLLPVRDDHDEPAGFIGVTFDITARKDAETALRTSEGRFRKMIENSVEGIWLIDRDGIIQYGSPSAARILGYELTDLIGTQSTDLVFEGDRDRIVRDIASLVREPSHPMLGEFRILHRSGAVRWVENSLVNLLTNPMVGALVSNFRDITDRKAAEATARASRRLLEQAEAVAHLGSWSSGPRPDDPITWSKECARILGRDLGGPPTFSGFLQMVHSDDRARVLAAGERAVAGSSACETRHRVVLPAGDARWVDSKWVVEGVPPHSHFVGVIKDITEAKRLEDELRSSDLRYRRIVEHTSEGIWMYDGAGTTTYMNPRMAEMLGCTAAGAVGQSIYSFVDDEMSEAARARVARRKAGIAERGEMRLKRRDGTDLWVSIHADALFDAAGKFETALALLTDITERRKQDELRTLLASVVASSQDAIISRGIDGVIRTWNHGAEKLTMYSATEAIGQPISMLYRTEDAARLDSRRGRVDLGEPLHQFEMVIVRKDGSLVEVSVTTSVLSDADGQVIGASIIARDISERRRAEAALRRTEDQLRQSLKMEAVGSLAGGVAHDFNNLLSVILSYTEMLIEDLPAADPMRADLEEVRKAGRRATDLTSQLLAFSRKQILRPVVLDLNEVVMGVHKMLGRMLGEDIELSLLTSPRVGKIHADAGQIGQVIMNLVVNARDAMPSGGNLTIETSSVALDESFAAEHIGVTPGPHVMLAVTDTGIGMDRETQTRIFEPFFTTKPKDKGTGLGLSTVYGIVQQSGGHIWVYSEPGKGTTFKIYLPRTDRAGETQTIPIVEPASLRGSETILLVEDDVAVRTIIRTILRRNGYHVLEADNGGEAFLVCEQFTAKIHLLLTDVVMPRMSGRQLAERLVQRRPDLKTLFISGYTEETIVHHGVLDAGIEFLPKPITPDALLRKVRQVLDGDLRRLDASVDGTLAS
ncbi:MAG: PAS domain S-box protein [Kofleriaceae bacterium]